MTLETGWLDDTPDGDTVLRQFLLNQADLGEVISAAVGGRHSRSPGLALADAAVPVPYLNQAVLLRPVLSPTDERLDGIDDFFATGGDPAMVLSAWPTPDLTSRGWSLIGHPVFVVRAAGAHASAAADDVTIRVADDAAGLALAERVVIDGYPLPEAAELPANSLFGPGVLGGDLRVRVAFVDGAPVAVGSGHVAHGVVNLCLAATLPAARRRGAWESLVWARVADAPDLPAAAFTSDDSRPGFIRMGFLPITRFTLWLRPPV
jgi:hypothetical protein